MDITINDYKCPGPARLLESKGGEQRPLGVRPGQIIKGPMGQIKEFTVWSKTTVT